MKKGHRAMSKDCGPGISALRDTEGRLPLSVIITTFNEEVNVEACIESVLWADEILLVDSLSTDSTVERARQYPIRILQREYYGSAAQKNWALDRVEHEWVLILDADERVTEPLACEIMQMLIDEPRHFGYYIRRQNIVLGKVIEHSGWSTDKVVRFFHRDHGRYPNRRVHADLIIDGPVPVLKHPLIHYTFLSFSQYLEKFLNYAEWGAAQGFREGRRVGFLEIAGRPIWRFFRTYFLQLGFLDGLHGLVICGLQAFGSFLKYARLWEYTVKSSLGQEIELPAFDESDETWARPEERNGNAQPSSGT
jgi:glycosyltransferase involved in cell wall biosynthesis